ncbi:MerR family transcriptional regulator [Streptomyces sp. NBC_01803]|uniref:MerR family transcriptional regulator n=1 Tax=Streptomyces sp. NBC_01803 TaxID=2975946 RepID=UPI002DD9C407|nr:MerR family transcriptional regulator [Streptomyces sp. NBC_01803]WSA44630.1 MerR family transcriptional regulator [Streptomyces sp. NBC_01803]
MGIQGEGTERSADRPREYRAAELAEAAGITVRTLRFYQERKLFSPPRREGRIVWYDEHHLARIRTITELLARGHTLGGIAELISAFSAGRDAGQAAELLGLSEPHPWSEEEPVRLTPEDLAAYYGSESDADNLAAALDIGYIAVDGDEIVHLSRDLLESSSAMVREGIPLSAILRVGHELRDQVDTAAEAFTELMRRHVLPEALGPAAGADGPVSEEDMKRLGETLGRLRPLVKKAVYAEISLAFDRKLRAELHLSEPAEDG